MSLYKQPTNGLEYWSIYLDNPNINFENLGEFTLICGMLTKIGTQKNSYEEFSALLNQYTGGIAFAACCASRLGYQNYHQFIKAVSFTSKSFKQKSKKGGYFESLIQKYLIDNPHRVRVELHPSKDYMKQQEFQITKSSAKSESYHPKNSQIATIS